ncbi:MAG: hypothetical protein XD74_1230, partial [Actinobacteria bacterium 66_15]
MRFLYTPVIPPFGGAGQNESVIADLMAELGSRGGVRVSVDGFEDPAPLVYVMATGGTERTLLDLQARRSVFRTG